MALYEIYSVEALRHNVAGYVGANHVAMVLATNIWDTDKTSIALDIGTNTEISLDHHGRLLCCS
ncbi:MAG: hypothetical protein ACUVRJ_02220 [Candidatus Villigracilaceae bacterium]